MSSTKGKLRQTLAILTVLFNNSSAGMSFGWVGPVLKHLQSSGEYFTLNDNQSSWIASLMNLGAVAGTILSAKLLDNFGRKFLLTLCAFIHLVSWFMILLTRSIPCLYLARLAAGLAYGLNNGVQSVYLGEISSPKNRGRLGFAINIFYNCAFLVSFSIATYSSYHITAVINSILQVSFMFSIFFIVEPPQFLLMKNKFSQAEKNFLWLKGLDSLNDNAKKELEKLKNNAYTEASKKFSYLKLLTYSANYRSILITLSFSVLEGSSGYFPIMFFAPTVFSSAKILTVNDLLIIILILKIIWAILLFYVVNRLNRRSILLFASVVAFLAHTFIAFLCYMEEHNIKIQYFPWLIFLSITFFMISPPIFHTTGILVRGELFPLSIKPLGNCLSLICYSGLTFLTSKIFLLIKHSHGVYLNFVIFSVMCFIMILFAFFILPETRNKSLIEIQEILEQRNKSVKFGATNDQ